MKKHLVAIALLPFVMSISSCRQNVLRGEGAQSASTLTVSSFNEVEMDMPLKTIVNVQPGSQPSVHLSGYENVIKHLKAKVENNVLYIVTDLDETWRVDCDGITANITVPTIQALTLEGAADAIVHGNVTGSVFRLDLSGAGSAEIDALSVDSFATELSGAASIAVKGGAVKYASYEISGAGKIKTFPLQTMETVAEISGAGKGEITALQKLHIEISGAGSIKYKGHPAITKDISGAGSVIDAN